MASTKAPINAAINGNALIYVEEYDKTSNVEYDPNQTAWGTGHNAVQRDDEGGQTPMGKDYPRTGMALCLGAIPPSFSHRNTCLHKLIERKGETPDPNPSHNRPSVELSERHNPYST